MNIICLSDSAQLPTTEAFTLADMSKKPSSFNHPLDPLSVGEIKQTVAAIRAHVAKGAEAPKPIEKILFNSIDLREPNKYAVLSWRGLFTAEEIEEVGGNSKAPLLRQAEVSFRRAHTCTD